MTNKKNPSNDSHFDTRLALLEQSIGHINETLLRFEKRFDSIESKFEKIEYKFDSKFDALDKKIDTKFEILDKKIGTKFHWTLGSILGLYAIALSTAIAAIGKSYGLF